MSGVVEIAANDRITTVEALENFTACKYADLWRWSLDHSGGVLRTYMRSHNENPDDFWIVREMWRSRGLPPQCYYTLFDNVVSLPAMTLAQRMLFPHISLKDSLKVAFTPSVDYGRSDRQVVTTLGRFLTKYYGGSFDEAVIRDFTTTFRSYYGVDDVKWALTGDEIEDVYRRSATTSCMTHPVTHYETEGIHPVRAYAGPDTRIAYLERQERVVSRTVVFEPKKLWVRIFGDDLLRVKLEKLGYKNGSLGGARLAKLELERYGRFVCPYLDGNDQHVEENGEFLVVRHRSDMISSERGWVAVEEERNSCRDCGDPMNEDDECYLEFYGESTCSECFGSYVEAHYMRGGQTAFDYIFGEDVTQFEDINSTHAINVQTQFQSRILRALNYVRLSECYYSEDAICEPQSTLTTADGETIHEDDGVEVANGELHHSSECLQLPGGEWVHVSDNLPAWMIDTQKKVFIYRGDTAEEFDMNTIPVQQWVYWSLCFMPREQLIAAVDQMFSELPVRSLLTRVISHVLRENPLLQSGAPREPLFKDYETAREAA